MFCCKSKLLFKVDSDKNAFYNIIGVRFLSCIAVLGGGLKTTLLGAIAH
jgi:hypothetical protein